GAGEEIVERGDWQLRDRIGVAAEDELAAMSRVDEGVDEGTAIFDAGLEAVAAFDERDVAEELIVGVDAAARVAGGGADGAVAADVDGRQPHVARREVRRQSIA